MVATAKRLRDFDCISEVWYPMTEKPLRDPHIETVAVTSQKKELLEKLVKSRHLSPANTLVITHGSWRFPSFWGMQMKKMGFKWIYTPHGMLNHEGLNQKKFKKKIYLKFIESPIAAQADVIRAVSYDEFAQLQNLFPDHEGLRLIPSGISNISPGFSNKPQSPRTILFVEDASNQTIFKRLISAWTQSRIADNPDYQLQMIARSTQSAKLIQHLLREHTADNILCIGPLDQEGTNQQIGSGSFFIGFSPDHSSLTNIMSKGLIPIIPRQKDAKELFDLDLAVEVSKQMQCLTEGLDRINYFDEEYIRHLQTSVKSYVQENYSTDRIAAFLYRCYERLLANQKQIFRFSTAESLKV